MGSSLFYILRKIKGNYYLYKVEYDQTTGRKKHKLLGNCVTIEEILKSQGKIKSGARRLARLGRRPHAAEARGSNPRGPTKQHNYDKNLCCFNGCLLHHLCSGGFSMSFSVADPSVLSYDNVSILSYDRPHQIFVVMTMKSRVNLGMKSFHRALSLPGSPSFPRSFVLERLKNSFLLWGGFVW